MKLILLSFALGLFLGLYLAYMYGVASFNTGAATVRNAPAQVIKKEAAQVEAVTGKQMDSLVRSNKKLQRELAVTKAALQVAKGKALHQQKRAITVASRMRTEKLPSVYINDCDSLVSVVEQLTETVAVRDSLHEAVALNLETQLTNKDSTIALHFTRYNAVQAAFEKSIAAQQSAEKETKALKKSNRRQQVKSKVVSTLLFIVTGVAATQIIHR